MTTCTEPRRTRTAAPNTSDRRPTADQLLRDVAFVLRMARRASEEIRAAAKADPRPATA